MGQMNAVRDDADEADDAGSAHSVSDRSDHADKEAPRDRDPDDVRTG